MYILKHFMYCKRLAIIWKGITLNDHACQFAKQLWRGKSKTIYIIKQMTLCDKSVRDINCRENM